jgi:hypothetical protein
VNKLFASFVPLGVVTRTLAIPATLAAMVAVMIVEFTMVKLTTEMPPIVTAVAPVKFVPVIVIGIPPDVKPVDGEMPTTVGGNTA